MFRARLDSKATQLRVAVMIAMWDLFLVHHLSVFLFVFGSPFSCNYNYVSKVMDELAKNVRLATSQKPLVKFNATNAILGHFKI